MLTLKNEEFETGIISKKNFCKIIRDIQKMQEINDQLYETVKNTAMADFPPHVCDYADHVIDVLSIMFRDPGEWISYFIYDLDFGKDYTEGCVTDEFNKNIDLSTSENLYDYLVSELEEEYGITVN